MEDILFSDSVNSYLVMASSKDTYEMMISLGSLTDDDKVLLRLQQGSAVKGKLFEE